MFISVAVLQRQFLQHMRKSYFRLFLTARDKKTMHPWQVYRQTDFTQLTDHQPESIASFFPYQKSDFTCQG